MRRIWLQLLICLALLTPTITGATITGTTGAQAATAESMMVILRDGTPTSQILSSIAATPTYTYSSAFTGFSANLTNTQITDLKTNSAVISVTPNRRYHFNLTPLNTPKPGTPPMSRDASTNLMVDANQLPAGFSGAGRIVAVIDSGADPAHPIFRISDPQTVRFTQTSITKLMQQTGIVGRYFSAKIPFGRNYAAGDNTIKEPVEASHGQHVAGIVAANPAPEQSQYGRGVAPETQLAIMRVFQDDGSTTSAIYSKALDDAIRMKVDAINLSLGSTAGEPLAEDPAIKAAFRSARLAGIPVSTATGNDGYWGYGTGNPRAENYDYGVTSSPAMLSEATAVAAANNTLGRWESLEINGLADRFRHTTITNATVPIDRYTDFRSVVNCGHGETSSFDGVDLTGRVALITLGWFDRPTLIARAEAKGADFIVFVHYNQDLESITPIKPANSTTTVVAITNSDGARLTSIASPQLRLSRDIVSAPTISQAKTAVFSSWGLSADGSLKPDISAPGSNVISSINDGSFAPEWGTSMAAPHIAGAIAVLQERVRRDYPSITGSARSELINTLLANTAKPIISSTAATFTSPRKQGSGLLNVSAALTSTVTATNGSTAKIKLGNITGTQITLEITLTNRGATTQTFTDTVQVSTDEISNGLVTLNPRKLGDFAGNAVTVEPNTSLVVKRTLQLSGLTSPPTTGYLDGFWRFESETSPTLTVPFTGFLGNWATLPVLEPSIYSLLADGKTPFYLTESAKLTQSNTPDQHDFGGSKHSFTHLQTTLNGQPRVLGANIGSKPAQPYDVNKIAFSPNSDGQADYLQFYGVFLRNFQKSRITVAAKSQPETVLWRSTTTSSGLKSYQDSVDNPAAKSDGSWRFTGLVGTPTKVLADGEYVLSVFATPTAPGGVEQRLDFPFWIDTVKPRIVNSRFLDDTRTFVLDEAEDSGSGVRKVKVSYAGETIPKTAGGYILPPGATLENTTIEIQDWAYNTYSASLAQSLVTTVYGQILPRATADYGSPPTHEVIITKPDGSVVDPTKLALGATYLVKVNFTDANYQLVGANPRSVTIPVDNPVVNLPIIFQKLHLTTVKVDYGTHSSPVSVASGANIFSPGTNSLFTANLPAGHYPLTVVDLLDGWTARIVPTSITVPVDGVAATITLIAPTPTPTPTPTTASTPAATPSSSAASPPPTTTPTKTPTTTPTKTPTANPTPVTPPQINTPLAYTSTSSATVSGAGARGAKITVFVDARPNCTATVTDQGLWSCGLNPPPMAGPHTLVARQNLGSSTIDSRAVLFTRVYSVTRISGFTAFDTAANLVRSGTYPQGGTLYLASGVAFPDALAAVPAAVKDNAPIALTSPDSLPNSVAEMLTTLKPSRVIIQGGRFAVSDAVTAQVKAKLPNAAVTRNRGLTDIDTAIVTAKTFTKSQRVFIANNQSFADALAGGPLSGAMGAPLLLVDPNVPVPKTVLAEIERLMAGEVVLLGGRFAIPETHVTQFAAAGLKVRRISGASAIDTALAISRELPNRREVFLTNNVSFADALAAGPLVPGRSGVLLLTEPKCVVSGVSKRIDEISPRLVTILGGGAAMARPTLDQLTTCT